MSWLSILPNDIKVRGAIVHNVLELVCVLLFELFLSYGYR
jgi:hypothetical protein